MQVLVTGGYGCIGAETVKWLLRNSDARVIVASRQVSEQRTERVFDSEDRTRIEAVTLDIAAPAQLVNLLNSRSVTHVVHLAALQTPDCNANRNQGLQTNLAGTQNLLEAVKQASGVVRRVVFASSIAVYGPRSAYPVGVVPMDVEPQPVNVYGVWKLAAEHVCRLFQQETGIPTVCLRPGVLYGPGRDLGLTSSPTTAIKCVALNLPYEVTFRTQQDYLFAPDSGAVFGNVLLSDYDGFGVFTMPRETINTYQFVEYLRIAAEHWRVAENVRIRVSDGEAPFICELDYQPIMDAFPSLKQTPIAQGIRQSLGTFLKQVQRGWLRPADVAQ
ncbi:MAG: NAD(P)-dependent oxidoreductase [Planctomycetales bacterium]|nr:NAD(P)-dependent oxidoreductase [Planctomycetales bacterium]